MLKKAPIVTVLTPIFNHAEFIAETIESILSQDFKDFEYLILDDGSTDNSAEVIMPYLKDKRLKYFKQENIGEAKTVNKGWQMAKGKYFAIVNSDDPVKNNYLSESVRVLSNNPNIAMSYSDWERIDEYGHRITFFKNKTWNLEQSLRDFTCYSTAPGTLINKSLLKNIKKLRKGDYKYICDTDSYWDIALKYDFIYIPKLLGSHRLHSKNLSRENGKLFATEITKYIKEFYSRNLPNNILHCEVEAKGHAYWYANYLIGKSEESFKYKSFDHFLTTTDSLSSLVINPLVSIVIPVYNGSNYIKEAIQSALVQTYKNIEIIVVNDGSTDNTEEIIKSFGNEVRYYNKKNGGVATALNLGIKESKGEYISWLSHDDLYFPEKIEKQINFLKKFRFPKKEIIFSDFVLYDIEKNVKQLNNVGQEDEFLGNNFLASIKMLLSSSLHGCSLLIPKKAFYDIGFFNEIFKTTQDYDLWLKLLKDKYRFNYIPIPLVISRKHEQQDTLRKFDLHIEEVKMLHKNTFKLFSKELSELSIDELLSLKTGFVESGKLNLVDIIEKKINDKFIFKNLQIGSYDLEGNKFNGHDLHLYLRKNNIDSSHIVCNKKSNDIKTFAYNFYKKDATKVLIKQKLFYDTDIVHMHLVHNILDLNYLPIITRLKPTILSLHDPYFLAGHCVHHFDCNKWQTHCKDCPYLNAPFALSSDYSSLNFELTKQAIQNSQIVGIVASKWMEEKVRQSPIWKDKKIYFLPYGINLDIFKPRDIKLAKRKLNIPVDNFVIMFRAALGPYKGLEIIKNALSKIDNSEKITLITVGGWKNKLFQEFKDKFNIHEYGWINDDDLLASLYNACDIFLMPSKQETFGMMAIEAMSCGKMVLVLEGAGTALPEVINSPDCGLAVSEENYSKELQRLIKNKDEIRERGQKSLTFAIEHYSKEIYIEKMIKIYKEVIANHQLDDSSKLILQQLKKYMINEDSEYFISDLVTNSSIFRRVYSKLPINMRKVNKKLFFNTARTLSRFVPKKIKNKIKSKINIKP